MKVIENAVKVNRVVNRVTDNVIHSVRDTIVKKTIGYPPKIRGNRYAGVEFDYKGKFKRQDVHDVFDKWDLYVHVDYVNRRLTDNYLYRQYREYEWIIYHNENNVCYVLWKGLHKEIQIAKFIFNDDNYIVNWAIYREIQKNSIIIYQHRIWSGWRHELILNDKKMDVIFLP